MKLKNSEEKIEFLAQLKTKENTFEFFEIHIFHFPDTLAL
jgi:hypothetical protein